MAWGLKPLCSSIQQSLQPLTHILFLPLHFNEIPFHIYAVNLALCASVDASGDVKCLHYELRSTRLLLLEPLKNEMQNIPKSQPPQFVPLIVVRWSYRNNALAATPTPLPLQADAWHWLLLAKLYRFNALFMAPRSGVTRLLVIKTDGA